MSAPWYRSAVFYEVPPRAFRDSNGDGIGDLAGLTEKLDYLQWLGIDCIWVPPIFDSPLRDGGYDVSDFRAVHPELGTIDDVVALLDAAHARGMRVISDLVVNHTSDQHAWFQEARRPGSRKRDWYVWNDTPDRWSEARIIFLDTETSNWTWDDEAGAYFWHRFYSHQPDLNFDNPEVCDAMLDIVRFWLGLGFDGFRLDAVPYLYERDGTNGENLPETHEFLRKIRRVVDEEFGDKVLLAEANQWPAEVVDYFGDGDECHMNFHFPVMPRLYMAVARGHVRDIVEILEATPEIPEGTQWAIFLRNHDELTLEMVSEDDRRFLWDRFAPDPLMRMNLGIRRRLAPLLDGDLRVIELLHGLLLSLPGSPVLYYGDEIGMGDDYQLFDRDGVRTPMQWEPGTGAGFSDADPAAFYLPLVHDPRFAPDVVNVKAETDDPDSLLNWVREMLAARRRSPEMGLGGFEILDPGTDAVLAFIRSWEDRETLVLANVTGDLQEIRLSALDGRFAIDESTGESVSDADLNGFVTTVDPLSFRWLRLR